MKPIWVAALAVIFLSVPGARAIMSPDVTFIPSQISVNSSFIMIVDPHAPSSEVARINWVIFGIPTAFGEFTNVGNKWIYYVTDTNLFPSASYGTPYTMEVTAIPKSGSPENNSVNINVGNTPITSNTFVTGNNVYISACAGGGLVDGGISYKTYTDSLDEVAGKKGTMIYNPSIYCYTVNVTLQNGNYYLAFTANRSTDFGGGVSRVVVGGGSGTGSPDVKADSIIYNPVINPNQEFKIETFKITNLGTDNLTGLSISVPQQISSYLTITPKKSSLEHNESTYMIVSLHNIQSSTNISTFATLLSGSTEIKQIPVELRISVIGAQDPASCAGKSDMALCLGGICCGQICRTGGAQCCSSSDCSSGQTCSSDYKCTTSGTPGECEGQNDMTTCTGGRCCSGSCITGADCCSDSDCSIGETCSYINICEASAPNECDGKSEGASCSTGYCCSGECQECCTNEDCTGAGETCSDGICTGGTVVPPGGGIDVMTIALIGGGVAAAAVVGFFLFKKFVKKKGNDEGEEEFEEGGEKEEDEFSDEDFY